MRFLLNAVIIIAGCLISNLSFAAWPDSSQGRINAVKVLRKDFMTASPLFTRAEREAMYRAECNKPKKYFLICKYDKWTDSKGRADSLLAANLFAKRCKSEPLSCVVKSWASGYQNGVPSRHAPDPKSAVKDLTFACGKKLYGPACAHLGEMAAAGVGMKKDPKRALDLYKEACKAKDPYGCFKVTQAQFFGVGQKANPKGALSAMKKECKKGRSQACLDIGKAYSRGRSLKKDDDRAMSFYDQGCKLKNGEACFYLADSHARGRSSSSSAAVAFGLFASLCDQKGDPRSCHGLGTLHQKGIVVEKDLHKAAKYYELACEKDFAAACSALGLILMGPEPKLRNIKKGVDFLKKSCDFGDAIGCVTYAKLLEEGKHIKKNVKAALKLYATSCKKDQGFGCRKLGELYDSGKFVKKNHKKAKKSYEKGCVSLDDGPSCGALGLRYYKGNKRVVKNSKEALRYFRKACDLDHERSCAFLGDFYAEGKLIKKDYDKAWRMYQIACNYDDIKACYKGGMLIVDGKAKTGKFYDAVKQLDKACKADLEKACDAQRPIVFQARFEGILTNAFHPKDCEIWTQHPNSPSKNRKVITVDKNQFSILAGKYKGQSMKAKLKGKYFHKTKKKKIAQSIWALKSPSSMVEIEHHENWNFTRNPDPTKFFPGPESFSKDKIGGRSVYYSRDGEYLARNVYKYCTFIDNSKRLTAEHCTEIQALLSAQLVSTCTQKK